MTPMSQEDIEWFKSTFRPIPRPQLPDDSVEYSLYWIPPGPTSAFDAAATRLQLQEAQKSASELTKSLLKDYIWQREAFGLEVAKENGVTLLRGRTIYGDSIEDEWVVVYLLRELTKRHNELWVKVVDSDGEFLLIEAAGILPSWLEPEVAENRVWIHNGKLVILKPEHDSKKTVTEKLSLQDARRIIEEEPKRLLRSALIEAEAFYRLRNYPKQIEENLHSTLVTIPRRIAYLLYQKPAYISPAVEAFYTRDPISMRTLKNRDCGTLTFPPADFVTVSVKFTRVGYAQFKSQDFPIPRAWSERLPVETSSLGNARLEMGMKVSCGFEMLLSDPQNQDKTAVREMKILLEDIDTGDEKLPTDEEILKLWDQRDDDEKWLDISFDDLDGELRGRGRGNDDGEPRPGAFGDQSAQENLQRIVASFEKFLNDDSAGFDGADFMNESDSDEEIDGESTSDGEDKDLSFDEEEFSKMMREMMGMPPGFQNVPLLRQPRGKVEELESESEPDDSQQVEELSRQMEAELRSTGVLDLGRRTGQVHSKAGSSKGKEVSRAPDADSEQVAPDSEVEENASSIHLAKNLLESIQSQAGLPGPSGNLLGMMGMNLPRDDRRP
ncbi:SGT1 domain containing protein [Elaphomyces granulatus]